MILLAIAPRRIGGILLFRNSPRIALVFYNLSAGVFVVAALYALQQRPLLDVLLCASIAAVDLLTGHIASLVAEAVAQAHHAD